MSLAVRDMRYSQILSQSGKFRLWLVRVLASLSNHLLDQSSTSRAVPLMTEPYKYLEEMARSRIKISSQTQKSAFAVIATGQNDERRYLLQWNANWRMFNLIGGKVDNKKGDDNDFRRTIERELEEELGVICPGECSVGRELGQIELQQYSHREHVVKNYQFVLFDVSILPDLPIDKESPHYFARWLSTGRENIFVSAGEIECLCTTGGRPISATTRHVLQILGEISNSCPA